MHTTDHRAALRRMVDDLDERDVPVAWDELRAILAERDPEALARLLAELDGDEGEPEG